MACYPSQKISGTSIYNHCNNKGKRVVLVPNKTQKNQSQKIKPSKKNQHFYQVGWNSVKVRKKSGD